MSLAFFDSNVLIYAFSDDAKSSIAQHLLDVGGVISVQTLNEIANVMRRKQQRPWANIHETLEVVRNQCGAIVALDDVLHRAGLRLAERYLLSVYDGMIVAAGLAAGCDILYSEDMHDGLIVDGTLRIVDPFVAAA